MFNYFRTLLQFDAAELVFLENILLKGKNFCTGRLPDVQDKVVKAKKYLKLTKQTQTNLNNKQTP
jgi:hypothetical protein